MRMMGKGEFASLNGPAMSIVGDEIELYAGTRNNGYVVRMVTIECNLTIRHFAAIGAAFKFWDSIFGDYLDA